MSYSASDLADHINRALVQLGYTIGPVEEDGDGDGDHYWDLGSNGVGSVNSPANAACADAVDDLVRRIQDLQNAAGKAIAEAQQGQMTAALAALKVSLDASIPGDIDEFIGGAQTAAAGSPALAVGEQRKHRLLALLGPLGFVDNEDDETPGAVWHAATRIILAADKTAPVDVVAAILEIGKAAGREEAQASMRQALGISHGMDERAGA